MALACKHVGASAGGGIVKRHVRHAEAREVPLLPLDLLVPPIERVPRPARVLRLRAERTVSMIRTWGRACARRPCR